MNGFRKFVHVIVIMAIAVMVMTHYMPLVLAMPEPVTTQVACTGLLIIMAIAMGVAINIIVAMIAAIISRRP